MLQLIQLRMQQVTLLLHPVLVAPLFLLFFTYFLFKWLNHSPPKISKSSPPSPPKLPILGNLHQLSLYPHKSLLSLAHYHGPLMLLHFGKVPVLVASSAEAAREIMKTHDIIFSNRPKLSITDKLLYNSMDVAAAQYGEYWRKMKSICVLQLLSNRRVQSFRAVREQEVAFLVKNIQQHFSRPVMNLSEMFIGLTNDVICRVAFGRKYNWGGKEGRKFKELLEEFMRLLGGYGNVGDFIPWLGWVTRVNGFDARAEKTAMGFDRFIDGIIEEHIENMERRSQSHKSTTLLGEDAKDFVDVLLELQKENFAEFSIDRQTIKALLLDIFVGGTDTSFTVLEWAMSELLRNPRVMKELQNEVRGIAKEDIAEADLDKMHYLKSVIKETLRLHPPFPLLAPRESTQDVKVMGYDVAAGTMVLINAYALGRDPITWSNPEEFCPERFLNCEIDFKGHDFQLIPFGAGRRGCPGISFAMAIQEVVLANLVKKFDWALPGGVKAQDLDMTECVGSITTHRRNPLYAIARPVSY